MNHSFLALLISFIDSNRIVRIPMQREILKKMLFPQNTSELLLPPVTIFLEKENVYDAHEIVIIGLTLLKESMLLFKSLSQVPALLLGTVKCFFHMSDAESRGQVGQAFLPYCP